MLKQKNGGALSPVIDSHLVISGCPDASKVFGLQNTKAFKLQLLDLNKRKKVQLVIHKLSSLLPIFDG
ncbi:hypothetical protein [Spirosoma litoris]